MGDWILRCARQCTQPAVTGANWSLIHLFARLNSFALARVLITSLIIVAGGMAIIGAGVITVRVCINCTYMRENMYLHTKFHKHTYTCPMLRLFLSLHLSYFLFFQLRFVVFLRLPIPILLSHSSSPCLPPPPSRVPSAPPPPHPALATPHSNAPRTLPHKSTWKSHCEVVCGVSEGRRAR